MIRGIAYDMLYRRADIGRAKTSFHPKTNYVPEKYLKGNKKVYKYKYSPYPNYFAKRPPKGTKKLLVKVYSYQSKKYGGFSPAYKKKVKAR